MAKGVKSNSAAPAVRQAALERELQLAKRYWLSVYPYVKDRWLSGVEWSVADHAHWTLREAIREAKSWNSTEEGWNHRVPADAFPDLTRDEEFRRPKLLCADETKPEVLAVIAGPLRPEARRTRMEAVREAHELLMTAQLYVAELPKRPDVTAGFNQFLKRVTFDEILRSNEENSERLPLLPPVETKRNADRPEGVPRLSKDAIKLAVERFLKKHATKATQKAYELSTRQFENDLKEGRLVPGDIRRVTYAEWQRIERRPMEDCDRGRISVSNLCKLRWERFRRRWGRQPVRKPPKGQAEKTPPRSKLPTSAATTQLYEGRREK